MPTHDPLDTSAMLFRLSYEASLDQQDFISSQLVEHRTGIAESHGFESR